MHGDAGSYYLSLAAKRHKPSFHVTTVELLNTDEWNYYRSGLPSAQNLRVADFPDRDLSINHESKQFSFRSLLKCLISTVNE